MYPDVMTGAWTVPLDILTIGEALVEVMWTDIDQPPDQR